MSRYSALYILARPDGQPTLGSRLAVYDVVIVGGGGHGLATTYHLAKEHGTRKLAVLEKGWLGGSCANSGEDVHTATLRLGGSSKGVTTRLLDR